MITAVRGGTSSIYTESAIELNPNARHHNYMHVVNDARHIILIIPNSALTSQPVAIALANIKPKTIQTFKSLQNVIRAMKITQQSPTNAKAILLSVPTQLRIPYYFVRLNKLYINKLHQNSYP